MTAAQLTQRAIDAHRQGDLDEADRLYTAALASDPAWFDARHMLGAMRIQQGRIDEAIALLSMALSQRPGDPHALFDVGVALSEAHRHAEAAHHFSRAAAARPDDAETLLRLGAAQMAMENPAAAVASFDRAVALRPDEFAPRFNRGIAHRAVGSYEAALTDLADATRLQPESAVAWCMHARVAHALGRIEDAAVSLDKAMALDPGLEDMLGEYAHAQAFLCNWRETEDINEQIRRSIDAGERRCYPFVVVGLIDDPAAAARLRTVVGARSFRDDGSARDRAERRRASASMSRTFRSTTTNMRLRTWWLSCWSVTTASASRSRRCRMGPRARAK